MDHFDEWTKTLARSTSRRDALKTLAGGTVGGLLALLGVGEAAAADCKRNGKACKKNSHCCSGNCASGTCAPLCPSPPACTNTCPCPSGQTCVNGTCCNNANVCGSVCCAACSTCQDGSCVSSCDSGKVCLSNGTCATPCASANGFCDGNRCGCGGCLCDRLLCGGAQTDTPCSSDNDCPSGQFCDGICIGAC
jgi:hypothetical protein